MKIRNLSSIKHYIFLSESFRLPKFWILPKLYELCKCIYVYTLPMENKTIIGSNFYF